MKNITTQEINNLLATFNYDMDFLKNSKNPNANRKFTLIYYNSVIESLLNNFFNVTESEKVLTFNNKKINKHRAYVYLNDSFKNKKVEEFNVIEYEKLYPHSILKLLKYKQIALNIPEFEVLFKFLVENEYNVKDEYYNYFWNLLINYTFGCLFNDNSYVKISWVNSGYSQEGNIFDPISTYAYNIMESIKKIGADNIIMVDTNFICYKDYETIDRIAKIYNIPFKKYKASGNFQRKKKYEINKIS